MINMNVVIWIIQGLLSLAFLMAGLMKMIMPKDKLREKIGGWVDDYKESQLKLIGLTEVIGVLGLILPMLFNIFPILTPIAACGLAFAMVGAAITHLKREESIITNVVLLLLALFVIIGRFFLVPVI
jgi:VIT1/CCC1 family predicted Fe2+/Mn2+ transporter